MGAGIRGRMVCYQVIHCSWSESVCPSSQDIKAQKWTRIKVSDVTVNTWLLVWVCFCFHISSFWFIYPMFCADCTITTLTSWDKLTSSRTNDRLLHLVNVWRTRGELELLLGRSFTWGRIKKKDRCTLMFTPLIWSLTFFFFLWGQNLNPFQWINPEQFLSDVAQLWTVVLLLRKEGNNAITSDFLVLEKMCYGDTATHRPALCNNSQVWDRWCLLQEKPCHWYTA